MSVQDINNHSDWKLAEMKFKLFELKQNMTFLRNIDKYKNKTAIITNTNLKISYKNLYTKSKSITQNLTSRSLVFLLSGNNMETIFYYVGLINQKKCYIYFR